MSAAVIVPVRDGQAAQGTPEAICEALDLTGDVDEVRVLLVGDGVHDAAHSLDDTGFADVTMQCASARSFAPGAWTAALAGSLADDEVVIVPGSVDGRDLGPRLATALARPFVAGAVSISRDHAVIPRAGGRTLAEVTLPTSFVGTLQPGVRDTARIPEADPVEAVDLEGFALPEDTTDAEVIGVTQAGAETMDLAEAPFIFGIGAGLGTVEVADELQTVAAALGASVGATRVVTDDGWLDHDRQIGTTGVVVNPRVYVAFGISGAVQHTAGLGSPEHVISVNVDGHCPMMSRSDTAIVADAPGVVAALRRRLTGGRTGARIERPSDTEAP